MSSSLLHHPVSKVTILLVLLSASFALAAQVPALLAALILSLLLAFILKPFVSFFEMRLGMGRTHSIITVFLILIALLLFNAAEGIPVVLHNFREMYSEYRSFPLDQKIDEMVRDIAKGLPLINPQTTSQRLRDLIDSSVRSAGRTLASALAGAISFLIVPFVTYYALAEGDRAVKRLLERVPNKYFEMTLNVVDKIRTDLVGYLRGWLLDSVIVAILNIIGFYLIGVQQPVLLGLIAGIANLIPYVGPFVGVFPVFLVAIAQTGDLRLVPSIVLLTLIIQAIDNIIVQPLCFSKTVDMHPLTVIVVCIVGNQLMGILGMLVAIPLYTILKVTALETHWGLKHYRITS
jgi:putative permease